MLALGDQLFLALTSVIVTFSIARAASPPQFGQFVLIQAVTAMAIVAFRSIPGTWLLLGAGVDGRDGHAMGEAAAGVTVGLLWGVLVGLGLVGLGVVASMDPGLYLGMAIGTPGVLVVEAIRLDAYSRGALLQASLTSAANLAALFALVGVAAVVVGDWRMPAVIYSLVFSLSALALSLRLRISPSLGAAVALLRIGRGTARGLIATFGLAAASQLAVPYLIAAGAGLSATAAVRGAQTLLGLALQVPQGLQNVFLVHAAKEVAATRRLPPRLLFGWSVIQVLVLGTAIPLFVYLPSGVGIFLLGETWVLAKPLIVVLGLSALAAQVTLGLELAFRALEVSGRMGWVRALTMLPFLVGVLLGASRGGAVGASVGLLVGNLIVLIGALIAYRSPEWLGNLARVRTRS